MNYETIIGIVGLLAVFGTLIFIAVTEIKK